LKEKWDPVTEHIAKVWSNNWQEITYFLQYPTQVRRIIYTTNSIEALNRSVRKDLKTRSQFPNDEAALKMVYLALQNATKGPGFQGPVVGWPTALAHFNIVFQDRLALA